MLPPIIVDTRVNTDENIVPWRSWTSLTVLSPRTNGVFSVRGSSSETVLSSESNDERDELLDIETIL